VKILGFKIAPAVGDIMEVPENPKDLEQRKTKTAARKVGESFTAAKQMPVEGEETVMTLWSASVVSSFLAARNNELL
jgi:hypothetical protein